MSFKIVPAIDLRDNKCVRLQQGDYDRQTTYDASPVDMLQQWKDDGAELVHIVDLDGAKAGKPCHLSLIKEMTDQVDVPCELGGGIRKLKDVWDVLDAGIDRVILGSALIKEPDLTDRLLEDLAPEKIVAGIDARDGKVAVHGWLEDSDVSALDLARQLADKGIREFIYTDISTDGMFTGPACEQIKALCEALPQANAVASGGIGTAAHVTELVRLNLANLTGVIVGKALYDGKVTFAELDAAVSG